VAVPVPGAAVKAFIIFRDRVTYGSRCFDALTGAGLEVVIADHGTTWPPALAWLDVLEACGTRVMRKGGGHPRELWGWEPFRSACGTGRYVVTDPDVVPAEDCPADWLRHLGEVLDNSDQPKAGLGLRTDTIPGSYHHRERVISWERQFWEHPVEAGGHAAYAAQIDTTLALYQPLGEHTAFCIEALRTGPPYVADHLAWYEDLGSLSPELRYYHENAEPGISFWTLEDRSAWNS
jgi:hypothetical protein